MKFTKPYINFKRRNIEPDANSIKINVSLITQPLTGINKSYAQIKNGLIECDLLNIK